MSELRVIRGEVHEPWPVYRRHCLRVVSAASLSELERDALGLTLDTTVKETIAPSSEQRRQTHLRKQPSSTAVVRPFPFPQTRRASDVLDTVRRAGRGKPPATRKHGLVVHLRQCPEGGTSETRRTRPVTFHP